MHLVARVLEWLRLCHEVLQEMAEATEQLQIDAEGAGQGSLIIDFQSDGESAAKVHSLWAGGSELSLSLSLCVFVC